MKNANGKKLDAQVIVAGAGPVGAFAAYRLAMLGIDVILLEEASHCREDLRASTIHPPTLEMFHELQAADDLIEQGLKAPVYQYRDRRNDRVISFDLSELSDMSQFPFRLQCEQFKVARLFAKRLASHAHGRVLFDNRVVHIERQDGRVQVATEAPTEIRKFTAQYLLAADGANSIVRKWLGTKFEGFTYPERFLTLSTDYPLEDHFPDLAFVNYVADPDEWVVMLRVPTLWRVQVPIEPDETADFIVSDEKKTQVFDNLIGNGESVKTVHRTVFNVHQRVAEKYNHGNIILIGDAAHLNNPLGGFGMNSGIHDARNVTDKLSEILNNGKEAAPLLDLFDRQRRAVMHDFIQAQTIQNKKMMEGGGKSGEISYADQLEQIRDNDELRRAYLLKQSMYQSLDDESAIN